MGGQYIINHANERLNKSPLGVDAHRVWGELQRLSYVMLGRQIIDISNSQQIIEISRYWTR